MTRYDAVIIGGGHNGLVAACYLAKAGRKVALYERRSSIGGACVTTEHISGYRFSSCAFLLAKFRPEILRDLDLKRFGLRVYSSDPLSTAVFTDDQHLTMWRDLDKTLAEIGKFSKADQEAFVDFNMKLKRYATIIEPWLLQAPPSRADISKTFRDAAAESLYDELVHSSLHDLLTNHFESPQLRGIFTFIAMTCIYASPLGANTASQFSWHSTNQLDGSHGLYGFVKGGMGGVTDALAACARSLGVSINTDSPVAAIRVRQDVVDGIVLDSGQEVDAPIVVSNADPRSTFLKLIPASHLSADVTRMAKRFDARGTMARIHLASDQLPAYKAFGSRLSGPEHRGHQVLGADAALFEKSWQAQQQNELPETFVLELVTQTAHDDSLAPPGKHTITLGVPHLPFNLNGGWDSRKDEFTKKVLDQLCWYAPNLKQTITGSHTITPLDLERDWGLPGGNIYQGAMSLSQVMSHRPFPGWGHYRLPVRNLYLCGSGAHPGGGVTGAPGHNAAKEILRDLADPPNPEQWALRARGGDRESEGTSPRDLRNLQHRLWEIPGLKRAAMVAVRQPWLRSVTRQLAKRR